MIGLGITDVRLCLDFINTEGVERNDPPDRLDSLDSFLEWAAGYGLSDDEDTAILNREAPEKASGEMPGEAVLARARTLREALYRIITAVTKNVQPATEDLSVLNRELAEALTRLRFVWGEDGARWSFEREGKSPEEILWPIAISAADLMGSELLGRVKECNSDTCSWMFIDESRNRSRRWCDMSDCGNRAKARRFYRRRVKGE